MKFDKAKVCESSDSYDTDTTDDTPLKLNSRVTWGEILPYLAYLPYMILFYSSWYFWNHNVVIMLFALYVVIPFVDMVCQPDTHNLLKKETKEFEKDKRFLIPLYSYFVLDYLNYLWAIYTFTYGEFHSPLDRLMFVVGCSHFAAIGMVVGHELLHRRETVHKIFGTLCYSKVMYSHFFIEHVKGHHKHVATPEDPSSSQKGESLYHFVFRSFCGGYESVWKYEEERLNKKKITGTSKLLRNRLVLFNLGHLLWVIVVVYFMGPLALIFLLSYSLYSVFMLEGINYVEHYGLLRNKDENGIYEPVNIKHSWNAPQKYTNYLMFKLQRHSDHHANSYKPYQILNSFCDSPTLLGGYSLAIITAYFPSVWYKVYDPLVEATMEERKLSPKELQQSESASFRFFVVYSLILGLACIY